MENILQITGVPVITAIVFFAMQGYKYIVNGNEKWIRLTPIFACILGVALGIVAFYAAKDILPADNVLTAILIGGASGLAATGTNQIYKQLSKGKEAKKTDEPADKTDTL